MPDGTSTIHEGIRIQVDTDWGIPGMRMPVTQPPLGIPAHEDPLAVWYTPSGVIIIMRPIKILHAQVEYHVGSEIFDIHPSFEFFIICSIGELCCPQKVVEAVPRLLITVKHGPPCLDNVKLTLPKV